MIDIHGRAIQTFGLEKTFSITTEKASRLISSISKWGRKAVDDKTILIDIIDLEIMLDQLKTGFEEVDIFEIRQGKLIELENILDKVDKRKVSK